MWFGKIADQLGLKLHEVKQDDFSSLSNGLHPKKNQRMIKKVSTFSRRMGIELVVLKPKSLSILYLWVLHHDKKVALILDRIDQASLQALLKFIEHEHSYVRIRIGPKRTYIKTQAALMANFSHLFNANLEPHWHWHVVIFPYSAYGEEYFAMQNEHIVKSQILYGLLYRADLMKRLLAEGIKVRVSDKKNGFFQLDEVMQEIIDMFTSRADEIAENKREFQSKYSNAPGYIISNLAKFKNRKKQNEREVGKIITDNVVKLQQSGFTREVVMETKMIIAPLNMAQIIYQIYQKEGEKLFEFSKERILKKIALTTIVEGIGAYIDEIYKPFQGGNYVDIIKQLINQQIKGTERKQHVSRTRLRVIEKYSGGVFELSKRAYQNARRTHKYFDEYCQDINSAIYIAIDERLFTLCSRESGEYRETLRAYSSAKTMIGESFFNLDDEVGLSQTLDEPKIFQKPN